MNRPKLLLFGAHGQLGSELARTLSALGDVRAIDKQECDLGDPPAIRQVIAGVRPDIVVNAAAYTAVDKAEAEPERARATNVVAPRIMAEAARARGAKLVHYSTDYVFDGRARRPYVEDDATGPLGVYGLTKLEGEEAIRDTGCLHLILRTSWVYGHHGANFVKTILRLAATRDELRIVDDQVGAPTWSRALAEVTALILVQLRSPDGARRWDEAGGCYHVTAGGQISWCEFTQVIIAHARERGLLPGAVARIAPTTTEAHGALAPRPRYSVLANDKLERAFGLRLPSWEVSCAQFFADPAAKTLGGAGPA